MMDHEEFKKRFPLLAAKGTYNIDTTGFINSEEEHDSFNEQIKLFFTYLKESVMETCRDNSIIEKALKDLHNSMIEFKNSLPKFPKPESTMMCREIIEWEAKLSEMLDLEF